MNDGVAPTSEPVAGGVPSMVMQSSPEGKRHRYWCVELHIQSPTKIFPFTMAISEAQCPLCPGRPGRLQSGYCGCCCSRYSGVAEGWAWVPGAGTVCSANDRLPILGGKRSAKPWRQM
jgi:hypothetical protein